MELLNCGTAVDPPFWGSVEPACSEWKVNQWRRVRVKRVDIVRKEEVVVVVVVVVVVIVVVGAW